MVSYLSKKEPAAEIFQLLESGQFGAAVEAASCTQTMPEKDLLDRLICRWNQEALFYSAKGEVSVARQRRQWATALKGFRDHGPQPTAMVRQVDLLPGYDGKIMLLSVQGDRFGNIVCLRSGDDWHQEILRNTVAEIHSLGFTDARVFSLGGAYATFEGRCCIRLWGNSEYFGGCDKSLAADLIKNSHPSLEVIIEY